MVPAPSFWVPTSSATAAISSTAPTRNPSIEDSSPYPSATSPSGPTNGVITPLSVYQSLSSLLASSTQIPTLASVVAASSSPPQNQPTPAVLSTDTNTDAVPAFYSYTTAPLNAFGSSAALLPHGGSSGLSAPTALLAGGSAFSSYSLAEPSQIASATAAGDSNDNNQPTGTDANAASNANADVAAAQSSTPDDTVAGNAPFNLDSAFDEQGTSTASAGTNTAVLGSGAGSDDIDGSATGSNGTVNTGDDNGGNVDSGNDDNTTNSGDDDIADNDNDDEGSTGTAPSAFRATNDTTDGNVDADTTTADDDDNDDAASPPYGTGKSTAGSGKALPSSVEAGSGNGNGTIPFHGQGERAGIPGLAGLGLAMVLSMVVGELGGF
ncbi:MAG: hypothetical protein Q9222_005853 [Ikaeria aurantiellina]